MIEFTVPFKVPNKNIIVFSFKIINVFYSYDPFGFRGNIGL